MTLTPPVLRRREVLGLAAAALCSAASSAANSAHRTALPPASPTDILTPQPVPLQSPAKWAMADLPDVKLWHWDTAGEGKPIVLAHPMTGSALVWEYQQPVFASAGYRVIGYSRRGHHGSEPGPKSQPGSAAADLRALASALGVNKFHLIASGGGAFGALDYAVSYPETLLSLVLACSTLNIQEREMEECIASVAAPDGMALPAYYSELGPSYRAADPAGAQRWVDLERMSKVPGAVDQGFINRIDWVTLQAMKVPTLLLAGDADLISPPPMMAMALPHIPNSRLSLIDQCGHSAYWERPVQFNARILEFIGSAA
jgi:pimeloyl-ACP methyl ester carboxylesterase